MATIALVFPQFSLKIKESLSILENVYDKIYLFTNEPDLFSDFLKLNSDLDNIQILKISKFPSFNFLYQVFFVLKEKIDLVHFHVEKDSQLLTLQWMIYILSLKIANQMPFVISSRKILYPSLIKKMGLSMITVDNRNDYLKFKQKKMKVYLTLPNYYNYLNGFNSEGNKTVKEDLKVLINNIGSYVLLPEPKEGNINFFELLTEVNYVFYSLNDFSTAIVKSAEIRKNIFLIKIDSYYDFYYLLQKAWALNFVFNELPAFPLDIHKLSIALNKPIIINPNQEERHPHLCLNNVTGWVVAPQAWPHWVKKYKDRTLENKSFSFEKSNTKDDYQNTVSRFYASVLNQKQSWNL